MRVISKISPKALKTFPKMKFITEGGKQVPRCDGDQILFRVIGRAVGTKKGNSDYGQYTSFTGDFRATILETGEVVRSSKIFLPEMITGMLESSLVNATAGADFAFDIGVTEANTPTGYQYTVTSLLATTDDNDPLANLLASVAASAPALPAPKIEVEAVNTTVDEKVDETKKSSKK
jgi:hypothetical protein